MDTVSATRPADTADTEIRTLIAAWTEAVRAADVDRIMAFYDDEVIAYDAIAQLRFVGSDAYREHWALCMSMCAGMIFEPGDITSAASGDVAFAHFPIRCGGTGPDGKEMSSWMRATEGYRKIGGEWRIVHEHFSAPFDPESGKAIFDAQP